MRRVVAIVVGSLVGLVVLVVLIGYRLPARHRATRSATFAVSAESLYALISAVANYPSWRTGVKSVEVLPAVDGRPQFREQGGNGAILYSIDVAEPGRRMVTRIADPKLPFGGTWTYEITPSGSGATLRVTEDGEVYNPVFRFVSHFFMSQTATMDRYLTDIGNKLGASVAIQE